MDSSPSPGHSGNGEEGGITGGDHQVPVASQQGQPPHHFYSHGVMIDPGNGEYYDFGVGEVQYTVPAGVENGGYPSNSEDFNAVFSFDDLCEVVDPSSVTSAVTDAEGNASWQCGFIPIGTSDMRQLHGSTDSSVNSNEDSGPYYRLIEPPGASAGDDPSKSTDSSSTTLSDPLSGVPGEVGKEGSGGSVPPSPAAGVSTTTSKEQAPVKVRKPRGRKPKHVKEAEAAAAAAAAAEKSGGIEKTSGEISGSGGSRPLAKEDKPPPSSPVTQHQSPTPCYPGGVTPQQGQMSLEQLAYQDRRRLMITQRPGFTGNAGGNAFPGRVYSAARAFLPQNAPPGYPAAGYHPRQYVPPSAGGPRPNPPSTPVPSPHPSNANTGGRLDHFFSSRISAPTNRCVVKPKLIQENRSIYNLLTAPTTVRPLENCKSSEERWRQTPCPCPLPEDASSSGTNITPNRDLPLDRPPLAGKQTSRIILGGGRSLGQAVNIRRESDPLGAYRGGEGNGTPSYLSGRPSTPSATSAGISGPRGSSNGVGGTSGSGYAHSNQVRTLQHHLESALADNYELKCRVNVLTKGYSSAMARLRRSYEQSERLRMALHNERFNKGFGGMEESVLGGRTTLSSYLEEVYGRMPRRGGSFVDNDDDGVGSAESWPLGQSRNTGETGGGEDSELFLEEDFSSLRGLGGSVRGTLKRGLGDLAASLSPRRVHSHPPKKACVGAATGTLEATETPRVTAATLLEVKKETGEDGGGSSTVDLSAIKIEMTPLKTPEGSPAGAVGTGTGDSCQTERVTGGMMEDMESTTSTLFASPTSAYCRVGATATSSAPISLFRAHDFTFLNLKKENDVGATATLVTEPLESSAAQDSTSSTGTEALTMSAAVVQPASNLLVEVSTTATCPVTTS